MTDVDRIVSSGRPTEGTLSRPIISGSMGFIMSRPSVSHLSAIYDCSTKCHLSPTQHGESSQRSPRIQMALIVGRMHLSLFALSSSRSFSLLRRRLWPRDLSALGLPKTSRLHTRAEAESSSLALSTLGLSPQVKPGKKKDQQNYHVPSLKSAGKASPSKNKSIPQKQTDRKNATLVDESLFSAKTFAELGLPSSLVDRLVEVGVTVPTDVQSAAIPTISQKHDAVLHSYTGSGKTLAYVLPILAELGPFKKPTEGRQPEQKQGGVEAVIIAPSRELGMQIVREVEKLLGSEYKKLVQQLVGGANRSRQEEALKKNRPIIVVGTPGRISEISAAGKLHTHGCQFLVLDEVDQLLSFNYREDMHRILEHVGRRSGTKPSGILGPLARRTERQTILVSATVPFSVIRAARSWGRDPLLVRAKSVVPLDSVSVAGPNGYASNSNETSTPNSVTQAAVGSLPPALKHYYCISKIQHKVDALRRCIHALDANSVIVFLNNTKPLKDVVFKLEARGMTAAELHGDLGKLARTTTLKKFKNGELRVLVTNELSARGLDVPECDLVVNLDLPTDSIHYAHRAGRTGRLGRSGNVVTICEEPERFVVEKMQRQLSVPIKSCDFTEGKLVVHKEKEEEEMAN